MMKKEDMDKYVVHICTSCISKFCKIEDKLDAVIASSNKLNLKEIKLYLNLMFLKMDGVIINSSSIIGDFSIINTKTSIDHDCKIGDYVHIAPGVTISGGVKIGNNTFIGAGATIIQYKKIGKNTIIGAGSVVVNDLIESGTYAGIPARKVK